MNTTTELRQHRHLRAGLAAILLAGLTLADTPFASSVATADQNTDGGATAGTAAVDIDERVAHQKVRMAQDRIDRAFLYR